MGKPLQIKNMIFQLSLSAFSKMHGLFVVVEIKNDSITTINQYRSGIVRDIATTNRI